MNTLEILSKVREKADHWEERKARFKGGSPETNKAASDFRALQSQIEASLDEMTEGLLKQEQENNN